MNILLTIALFSITMPLFSQATFESWRLHGLQGLIAQQELSQKRYLAFLDQSSISAGIYELKAGEQDQQQPHIKDEIYFILSGASDFTVEHETTSINTGDILFVRAGLDHKFSNISQDLKILVWFSGSANTDHDFDWKKWTHSEVVKEKPNENSWNDFLKLPSMTAGLYQLPEKVGEDSTLTHQVDEINYVVKGQAKFQIGEEEIEVFPGSVVYVKSGNGHRFSQLKGDFEVFIMFGKKE